MGAQPAPPLARQARGRRGGRSAGYPKQIDPRSTYTLPCTLTLTSPIARTLAFTLSPPFTCALYLTYAYGLALTFGTSP